MLKQKKISRRMWMNVPGPLHSSSSQNSTWPQLSLNPSYFSRLFKQSVGVNISSYLISLRMNKVMAMRKDSPTPIDVIARSVGYQHIPLFYNKSGSHSVSQCCIRQPFKKRSGFFRDKDEAEIQKYIALCYAAEREP